jgi:hypothetical protein
MLPYVALILLIVGAVLLFAGHVWLIMEALHANTLLAFAVIFFPAACILVPVFYWDRGWRPFATEMTGLLMVGLGCAMGLFFAPQ